LYVFLIDFGIWLRNCKQCRNTSSAGRTTAAELMVKWI